jgi:hypothetical protein
MARQFLTAGARNHRKLSEILTLFSENVVQSFDAAARFFKSWARFDAPSIPMQLPSTGQRLLPAVPERADHCHGVAEAAAELRDAMRVLFVEEVAF